MLLKTPGTFITVKNGKHLQLGKIYCTALVLWETTNEGLTSYRYLNCLAVLPFYIK